MDRVLQEDLQVILKLNLLLLPLVSLQFIALHSGLLSLVPILIQLVLRWHHDLRKLSQLLLSLLTVHFHFIETYLGI